MALTIGDNFSYLGAKPLDGRLKYDTISAMVGMSASTLYDGIMAYCAEDGKEYQWKSSNTSDPTLGKWREFKVSVPTAYTSTPEMDGAGAAGTSESWAKGDHVHPSDTSKSDLSNLAAQFDDTTTYAIGDRCTYNGKLYRFTAAHTGAWVAGDATEVTVDGEIPQELTAAQMQAIKDAFTPNGGAPLRMFNYSTDEQVVGTWIDGKPIYQKTIQVNGSFASEEWNTVYTATGLNIKKIILGYVYNTNLISVPVATKFISSSNAVQIFYLGMGTLTVDILTIQYTKTTD